MARIRSVSPDLRVSETAAAWPREVRYAWVLLWGYLDDYGRGLDNPRVIAADLFPLDDDVTPVLMARWLDMWEMAGSICRYSHEGKRWLHVVNWRDHQKPQHPGKVRIPPCPEHQKAQLEAWDEARQGARDGAPPRPSGDTHEDFLSHSPTRGRGSKEEEKEGEGEARSRGLGGDRLSTAPPQTRYPDHCPVHAHDPTPPNCGHCKETRENRRRQALTAPSPATRCPKPGHEHAVVNAHGCGACRSEGISAFR